MSMSGLRRSAVAGVAVLALLGGSLHAGPGDGAWAERVQVVYDAATRSVKRVRLRVWDFEPDRNLEFLWEPAPGTQVDATATDSLIEGRGKLVWLVRGAAAHDRSAIHSTYQGEMRDGRRHGTGRLDQRDGQVLEGEWRAGLLHGQGTHLDAAGNRYTGPFVNGRPHGEGRYAAADGSIFEGPFVDGRRHGEGRMRLAGGTEYVSVWRHDVEIGGNRPDARADALVGGLLRAQGDGGDAGKVQLSFIVEPRMTQQSTLRYTQYVQDDYIDIFPDDPGILGVWTGENTIELGAHIGIFDYVDWEDAPVFVQASFETSDRSRVKLDSFELQVDDSMVYRKPFLSTVGHYQCVGYRPAFSFQNIGWGAVRDATLSLEFYNKDAPEQATRRFSLPVGSFDQAVDVSMEPLLQELGVDTAALARERFSCPSQEQAQQCRPQVTDAVDFGEAAPLLSGDLDFTLGVRGDIVYRWGDDRGDVYDQTEKFDAAVRLAYMETELMVAEGGDGWGAAPEALRYQEIRLPSDRQNYVIDMPVRGNKNLAAYVARLKVFANENSFHTFRVAARFEDGSERYSKPVRLFYARPNIFHYEPPDPPGATCYLDPAWFEGP